MKRRTAALAAILAALLTLAGCSDYKQGPAGRVIGKDTDKVGKHTDYELTVRQKSGAVTEFEVDSDVYGSCYRGSAYPRCTEVDR